MTRPKGPALTVDAVWSSGGAVLLVRRGRPPFRGAWALPGGFVELGETTEEAVVRELREETGLTARPVRVIGVYSRPGRDPRGHTVSIAYGMHGVRRTPTGGDDAAEASWVPLAEAVGLAFDHDDVIRDARRPRRY